MGRILLALLATLALASPALASTQSEQLAAQHGITNELAERDIAVQRSAGDACTRVSTALGTGYGGCYFNDKTGYFMVPLPPGADKAAAQGAVEGLPAKFPAVKRSYAQLEAVRAQVESEQQAKISQGQALVAVYDQGNTVRLYFNPAKACSSCSGTDAAAVKTQTEGAGAVAIQTKESLKPGPLACRHATGNQEEDGTLGDSWGTCEDHAVGGISIREVPTATWYTGSGAERGIGCTLGFMVAVGTTPMVLTAGHCPADGKGGAWLARPDWECFAWPFGDCKPVAPWPPAESECLLHNGRWELDEGGDMGLMSMTNCVWEPLVATWFEPQEEVAIHKSKMIFDCTVQDPGCNGPPQINAYPGLWECHFGMNAESENAGSPWGYHCGEVKYADTSGVVNYSPAPIDVHHIDIVCAGSLSGDSGSPTIAGNRATGILIAGGLNSNICPEEKHTAWIDRIGTVLPALGAHLP